MASLGLLTVEMLDRVDSCFDLFRTNAEVLSGRVVDERVKVRRIISVSSFADLPHDEIHNVSAASSQILLLKHLIRNLAERSELVFAGFPLGSVLHRLGEAVDQDVDCIVTTVGGLGHSIASFTVGAHDLNS
jgi:hypothetical protein